MTGRIIPLHGNAHRDIEALLPWFVTGSLGPADASRVAAHLDSCADCTAALATERRLERELTRRPGDVEQSWAVMRERLDLADTPRARSAGRAVTAGLERVRGRAATWFAWGVGAQLALAAVLALIVLPGPPPAAYRTLGAAAAPVAGNLVVIFRPETSERVLRQTLRAGEARLIDGPTEANAYIVQVPTARRDAVLAAWRAAPQVVLAEPIDAARRP